MPIDNMRGELVAGPLANVSIAYKNPDGTYIADQVYPIIDNCPPEAKITTYSKGAWFRNEAGPRGEKGEARRGGFKIGSVPISTMEYAFASEVTDEERDVAALQNAPPLNPDTEAIEFASDKIQLEKEIRTANNVISSTWSGLAGGEDAGGLWAAGSGNTFLKDVRDRREFVRSQTGLRPNKLVIDEGTYNSLKEESTILDKIKYTERGVLTKALLAAILELDEIIIAGAIESTAKEKKDGTDWNARNVWEKNQGKGTAFLYYYRGAPALRTPMAGAQARTKYRINQMPVRTTTWREASKHQDVYEVAEQTHILQVCADLGFLWYDTLLT